MKALSLFSGIGGIDLACEWAGIETVAFCERDKFCQKVLAKHWPDVPIFDDVTTLRGDQIGAVDLITGGYPCQPESTAGKRGGTGDNRWLWPAMLRLVRELRPAWVLGENVLGHVSGSIDIVLGDLESEGYQSRPVIFPAAAVGAWHRRDRVFIVAYTGGEQHEGCGSAERRTGASELPAAYTGGKRGGAKSISELRGKNSPLIRNDGAPEYVADTNGMRELQPQGSQQNEWGRVGDGGSKRGCVWATEPDVGRVAHGIPRRVDRLRALGNAVVPQQVYPILAAMKETHDLFQEAPNEQ